jgi:hypothetical protein
MAIEDKLKGTQSEFRLEDFIPTKWSSAEEKAKIANKLTRFILGGFQRSAFTKDIYQQLSNMFGHIAHYDINGFYETWFADVKSCKEWLEHVTDNWLSGMGDPRFTWSDVENVLLQWIKEQHLAEQLENLHRMDIEQKELALLSALQQKYAPQVEEVDLLPVDFPAAQRPTHQMSLF